MFQAMVDNGHIRCEEFSEELITQMWLDTLSGPVAEAFRTWKMRPALVRWGSALCGICAEGSVRRLDVWRIHHGGRLLSSPGSGLRTFL